MLLHILITASLLAIGMPAPRQDVACEPPTWGNTVSVFESGVKRYIGLRERLEAALPQPIATLSVGELKSTQQALAARIRRARATARQGDLLSVEIAIQIRRSLRRAMDAHTWKVIMDDNPGEQPSQVNDQYREGRPLATMPPNVLAALPRLPEGIEYRFVDRHLILLDTRALVIIDRVPFAIAEPGATSQCK